jgi:hypothetical protein
MSYVEEVQFLERYLTVLGFKPEQIPNAMPGEEPIIIRLSDQAVFEGSEIDEPIAAGAHLWSLLMDLEEGVLSPDKFGSFGGSRCREIVSKKATELGLH